MIIVNKSVFSKKTILVVLLVIWMAFIFSMSSQNSHESSNTSGSTIKAVLSTVPEFNEQPTEVQEHVVEELQFVTRKSAHFIAYMILGILTMLSFLQFNQVTKKPMWAFLLCVAYAISDEIHQLFVPGRAGQLRDVLIDSSGSIVGIAIVLLFVNLLQMRKERKMKTKLA